MDLDLHPIYKQIDEHILRYVKAANIANEDHWVEERLQHPHDCIIVVANNIIMKLTSERNNLEVSLFTLEDVINFEN